MWNDLTLSDKARMIQLAVKSGITDLNTIQQVYNTFAQGGNLDEDETIKKVNSSRADFVKRLKDPNREYIDNGDGTVSTHRMAYADDGRGNAVVYPEIQRVKRDKQGRYWYRGKLEQFNGRRAYENAMKTGDYVPMSTEEADWFTRNYKDYYPEFNKYEQGGNMDGDPPYSVRGKIGDLEGKSLHYIIENLIEHPATTIQLLRERNAKRRENKSPEFGGGKFRGAGAGGYWNEETLTGALDRMEEEKMKDKIVYTPGPTATSTQKKSFGQIFREHKNAGDKGFWLDGIYYTTEEDPNAKIGKPRYHSVSISTPTVTREVENSEGKILSDSTATSFYSGQRMGKFDRKDDPNETANRINGLPFYNGEVGFNGIKAFGGPKKPLVLKPEPKKEINWSNPDFPKIEDVPQTNPYIKKMNNPDFTVNDIMARIYATENSKDSVKGGYNKKEDRWYPVDSPEGGKQTVAYGIKLGTGSPEALLAERQGYLTGKQADDAVRSLALTHMDTAKRIYDKKFGVGSWDTLSPKSKSILSDYSFNVGLQKFPKLMEGFYEGNIDKIKDNYKRYTGGKPLKGRNEYVRKDIDSLNTFYPILIK